MALFWHKPPPSSETVRIYRRALAGIALACGMVMVAISLGVLVGLRMTTGLLLAVPIRNIQTVGFHERLLAESDRPRFQAALAPLIKDKPTTEAKVLTILDWTMDQVSRVENFEVRSSWRMVELAHQNRGLICGGMAHIFHDALISNGIPARIVLFRRDIFDPYDSHATVEAFVDGKWRVYDPTFHITLKRNNENIGALDARQSLVVRKLSGFEIENLGTTRYPSPIDRYYVKYTSLLDNVFVQKPIYIGGVRVPIAFFCLNCGVSERSNMVYFYIILSLVVLGAMGGVVASAGAIGLFRTRSQ